MTPAIKTGVRVHWKDWARLNPQYRRRLRDLMKVKKIINHSRSDSEKPPHSLGPPTRHRDTPWRQVPSVAEAIIDAQYPIIHRKSLSVGTISGSLRVCCRALKLETS